MPRGISRGDFCFLPHYCKHCGKPIILKKERINAYEYYGYPEYILGHFNLIQNPIIAARRKGCKNPKVSEWMKLHNPMKDTKIAKKTSESQKGSKNHRFGKKWSPEEKEKIRNGMIIWHKKRKLMVETPMAMPEVVPNTLIQAEITASVEAPVSLPVPSIISPISVPIEPEPIILSQEDKLKVIFKKMEAQRQARIAEYKAEDAKKPKELEKRLSLFGKILCVKEGKYIKCKNPKAFCSQWEFCHNKVKNDDKN